MTKFGIAAAEHFTDRILGLAFFTCLAFALASAALGFVQLAG